MIEPSHPTIVEQAPNEARELARKRARDSVWMSVGTVGVSYLVTLPLAALDGEFVGVALFVPFIRSLSLIFSDDRPEAKADRSQMVGFLVIGTGFGIWGILQGGMAAMEHIDPAGQSALGIPAILSVMALASLLPIIGLHRAEFRRIRQETR